MKNNCYKIDSTVLCALIIKIIQNFGPAGLSEDGGPDEKKKKKEARTNRFDLVWTYTGLKGFNNNLELYAGVKNRGPEDKKRKYLRKPGWLYTSAETSLLGNKRQTEVSALDNFFSGVVMGSEDFPLYAGLYPAFCPEDRERVTLGRLFYHAFRRLGDEYRSEDLAAYIRECLREWKAEPDIGQEVLGEAGRGVADYEVVPYEDLVAMIVRNAEVNCIKPLSLRSVKTLNIERIKPGQGKEYEIIAELNIREDIYLGEVWESFTGSSQAGETLNFSHLGFREEELPPNVRDFDSRTLKNLAYDSVIAFDVSQTSAVAAVYNGGGEGIRYYRIPVPEIPLSVIYPGHIYISRQAAAEMFSRIVHAFTDGIERELGISGYYLIFSVRGRVTPDKKVVLNDNIRSYALADASLARLFPDHRSRLIVMNNGNARVAAEASVTEKRSIACVSVKNGIGFGYMNEDHVIFKGSGGAGCELGDCPYDHTCNIEEALRIAGSGLDPAYDRRSVLCHALRYVTYLMAPRTIFILDLSADQALDIYELRREFVEGVTTGGRRLAEGYQCELMSASFGEFQAVIGCLKAADMQLEGGRILI